MNQVGKLEALLGRIQKNRQAVARHAAQAAPVAAPAARVAQRPAPEPTPAQKALAPKPAVVELTPPPLDDLEPALRPPAPTPMEMALEEGGYDTILGPGPIIAAEPTSMEDVEITVDEEEFGEEAQTAPVGTRAAEPVAAPAVSMPVRAAAPEPQAPMQPRVEPAKIAPEPIAPRPISIPQVAASAPVARVVSQPTTIEPATFGELLERTLALRPR